MPRLAPSQEEPEPEPEPERGERAHDYRVAAGTLERSAALEQEVGQLRDRVRAMEREVYAARKIVRRRRALTAVSSGGVGATIGAVLAIAALMLGLVETPAILLGLVMLGWVFGAVIGYRWEGPGDFPAAPPPRMM